MPTCSSGMLSHRAGGSGRAAQRAARESSRPCTSHHFGLREPPFGSRPIPLRFSPRGAPGGAQHAAGRRRRNGEGFIKITGEVGTGKTLLCRHFLRHAGDADFVTAYIPNPLPRRRGPCCSRWPRSSACRCRQAPTSTTLHKTLNQRLLDLRRGRQARRALPRRGAGACRSKRLEALRLLSNLETEKRKLLQVVLFGQPELDAQAAARRPAPAAPAHHLCTITWAA